MTQQTPPAATAPYLLANRLRFGDVILLRSAKKEADGTKQVVNGATIAAFGGGGYSHAAFVLGPLLLFESVDAVGWTHMAPDKLVKIERRVTGGSEEYLEFYDVSDRDRFDVYRHPSFPQAEAAFIGEQLSDAFAQFAGKQYPDIRELASAGRFGPFFNVPLRWVIQFYELASGTDKVVDPGPFCSSLVTRLYQDILQVPLFELDLPPDTVSPGRLASSKLVKISDTLLGYPDSQIPDELNVRQERIRLYRHFHEFYSDLQKSSCERRTRMAVMDMEHPDLTTMNDADFDAALRAIMNEVDSTTSDLEKRHDRIRRTLDGDLN